MSLQGFIGGLQGFISIPGVYWGVYDIFYVLKFYFKGMQLLDNNIHFNMYKYNIDLNRAV